MVERPPTPTEKLWEFVAGDDIPRPKTSFSQDTIQSADEVCIDLMWKRSLERGKITNNNSLVDTQPPVTNSIKIEHVVDVRLHNNYER